MAPLRRETTISLYRKITVAFEVLGLILLRPVLFVADLWMIYILAKKLFGRTVMDAPEWQLLPMKKNVSLLWGMVPISSV